MIFVNWDLTLDIYLSEVANNLLVSVENKFAEYKKTRKINYDKINNNSNKTKHNEKIQKIISFRPILISYSEITYNIMLYFRQRMRVSEGHTKGFRKKIIKIVKNERLTFFKLELFFLGLRYAKYIFIIFLVIIDFFLLFDQGINSILTNDFLKISFGIQGVSLIIYIIYNMLSLKLIIKL